MGKQRPLDTRVYTRLVKPFEGDIHNNTFEATAKKQGDSAQSSCGIIMTALKISVVVENLWNFGSARLKSMGQKSSCNNKYASFFGDTPSSLFSLFRS